MDLNKVGLLVSPSVRARFYVQALQKEGFNPARILYLSGSVHAPEQDAASEQDFDSVWSPEIPDYFDPEQPLRQSLEGFEAKVDEIEVQSPNHNRVTERVGDMDMDVFIYGGPGGEIVSRELLSQGSEFLHIHPGWLPDFRGSTTIYYSLLEEGRCGCSAFFFRPSIDQGPILKRRWFPAPENRESIDLLYDPYIRSRLLIDVLKDYQETGGWDPKPQPDRGETYYIIHPYLKHAAVY